MALAVSGMLAMSGSKVYASDTDTYTETIATGTDAVKEVEEVEETEEVEAAGEEEATGAVAESTEDFIIEDDVIIGETEYNEIPDSAEVTEDSEDALLLEEEDAPAPNSYTVYNGVDYSLVYDYQYYLSKYKDVRKAFNGDPEETLKHFVLYGMKEGRQGNSTFVLASYKNAYSDLRREYGSNNAYYYKHYITYGAKEHRTTSGVTQLVNPISAIYGKNYSGVYDFGYYTEHYSDMKRLFGNNDIAALEHFINNGMKEKRQAKESFDVDSYYLSYQDLRVAYNKDWKQYYMHYVNYGASEHRKTSGETTLQNPVKTYKKVDYSSVYDYYYYFDRNSDLRRIYGQDDIALMSHFVHYGMNEGRPGKASYTAANYNTLKKKSNEFIAQEKAEEEARRKAEEAKRKAEEEARRKAEEEKKAAEELAKRRAADPKAAAVLDRVGWTLTAAYNYAMTIEYEKDSKLKYDESWGSYALAQQGFTNGEGNCYVRSAVFYEMAKMMQYEVYQIAGYIPLINGGETPHSWCEVVLNGNVYVCDPDLSASRGNDAYMKPYGTKGIWKYQHYHRMSY
jgi:hypothetical protein